MLFTVSKDEWNTKEDTGKSLKKTLHVLRYTKRHLLGRSDIKQWKNQAHSLSRYQVMLDWRHQTVSQSVQASYTSQETTTGWKNYFLPQSLKIAICVWYNTWSIMSLGQSRGGVARPSHTSPFLLISNPTNLWQHGWHTGNLLRQPWTREYIYRLVTFSVQPIAAEIPLKGFITIYQQRTHLLAKVLRKTSSWSWIDVIGYWLICNYLYLLYAYVHLSYTW